MSFTLIRVSNSREGTWTSVPEGLMTRVEVESVRRTLCPISGRRVRGALGECGKQARKWVYEEYEDGSGRISLVRWEDECR